MPATVSYQVRMDAPHAHLFEVEMRVEGWPGDTLTLKLPVWTPGSYLVREYSRHIQDFEAGTSEIPLGWSKLAKQTWQVDTGGHSDIRVLYRVYANELTVRTSHLDSTHAYFNGACLFLYVCGLEDQPHTVTVLPPHADWQVTTALSAVDQDGASSYTYRATNYDELVDSPFEVGTHRVIPFMVLGKPHTLAIWGKSNLDLSRYLSDLESIITAEAKLFDGKLPYERYVFIIHFADSYGGLEHHNSTTLLYSRFELRPDDKYFKFICLSAHEFFHLWNVKRIRPSTLDRFDYEQENYTRSLWFMEGATSYYDEVIPLRAGIYEAAHYLKLLTGHITRLQSTPGRLVQPLEESSFDTWIKLYRPNENSLNSQVSYYLKGQLVCCLLDLQIRYLSGAERSLDDVMRKLWSDYGAQGRSFPEGELQALIEYVAGCSLATFFERTLRSTVELDYNDYFERFGLELITRSEPDAAPYLGARTQIKEGRTLVQAVEWGSPAHQGGLNTGDELLALNGWKVDHGNLKERLKDCAPGSIVQLTHFRREELITSTVQLEVPAAGYHIEVMAQTTEEQDRLLQGWLGPSSELLRTQR
ncbi:MAG: M61 family metallopeptidase [Gemmatimonadaceae bacterium]|nr:M61 family metallopeptidase [Gloeobacterales cyanobacterium ES-bin-141]